MKSPSFFTRAKIAWKYREEIGRFVQYVDILPKDDQRPAMKAFARELYRREGYGS